VPTEPETAPETAEPTAAATTSEPTTTMPDSTTATAVPTSAASTSASTVPDDITDEEIMDVFTAIPTMSTTDDMDGSMTVSPTSDMDVAAVSSTVSPTVTGTAISTMSTTVSTTDDREVTTTMSPSSAMDAAAVSSTVNPTLTETALPTMSTTVSTTDDREVTTTMSPSSAMDAAAVSSTVSPTVTGTALPTTVSTTVPTTDDLDETRTLGPSSEMDAALLSTVSPTLAGDGCDAAIRPEFDMPEGGYFGASNSSYPSCDGTGASITATGIAWYRRRATGKPMEVFVQSNVQAMRLVVLKGEDCVKLQCVDEFFPSTTDFQFSWDTEANKRYYILVIDNSDSMGGATPSIVGDDDFIIAISEGELPEVTTSSAPSDTFAPTLVEEGTASPTELATLSATDDQEIVIADPIPTSDASTSSPSEEDTLADQTATSVPSGEAD